MASVRSQIRGLVLSASELKELTGWPDAMVEDYLNILRNLITLAEAVEEVDVAASTPEPSGLALQFDLLKRLGSGKPLTSDETGFTVDSTRLTVDRTEA